MPTLRTENGSLPNYVFRRDRGMWPTSTRVDERGAGVIDGPVQSDSQVCMGCGHDLDSNRPDYELVRPPDDETRTYGSASCRLGRNTPSNSSRMRTHLQLTTSGAEVLTVGIALCESDECNRWRTSRRYGNDDNRPGY